MNTKTRQSRRQSAKVSHSRWVAYATAGAATALTASHSAEAAIHYTVVDKKFPANSNKQESFQLDQPGDSISFLHGTGPAQAVFKINGIAGAAFRGYLGYHQFYRGLFASKLSFGESIAAGHFTHGMFSLTYLYYTGILVNSIYGQWTSPGMGFVGFRFTNGAGPQYGWARVRISTKSPGHGIGYAFKVLDFAYGDPGEPITAGEGIPRGSEDDQDISDDQEPDEGSLGGLALGAVGLLAWRKSRSRAARSEGA
jgi:hypothetical protein